jgi:hypothetical protein
MTLAYETSASESESDSESGDGSASEESEVFDAATDADANDTDATDDAISRVHTSNSDLQHDDRESNHSLDEGETAAAADDGSNSDSDIDGVPLAQMETNGDSDRDGDSDGDSDGNDAGSGQGSSRTAAATSQVVRTHSDDDDVMEQLRMLRAAVEVDTAPSSRSGTPVGNATADVDAARSRSNSPAGSGTNGRGGADRNERQASALATSRAEHERLETLMVHLLDERAAHGQLCLANRLRVAALRRKLATAEKAGAHLADDERRIEAQYDELAQKSAAALKRTELLERMIQAYEQKDANNSAGDDDGTGGVELNSGLGPAAGSRSSTPVHGPSKLSSTPAAAAAAAAEVEGDPPAIAAGGRPHAFAVAAGNGGTDTGTSGGGGTGLVRSLTSFNLRQPLPPNHVPVTTTAAVDAGAPAATSSGGGAVGDQCGGGAVVAAVTGLARGTRLPSIGTAAVASASQSHADANATPHSDAITRGTADSSSSSMAPAARWTMTPPTSEAVGPPPRLSTTLSTPHTRTARTAAAAAATASAPAPAPAPPSATATATATGWTHQPTQRLKSKPPSLAAPPLRPLPKKPPSRKQKGIPNLKSSAAAAAGEGVSTVREPQKDVRSRAAAAPTAAAVATVGSAAAAITATATATTMSSAAAATVAASVPLSHMDAALAMLSAWEAPYEHHAGVGLMPLPPEAIRTARRHQQDEERASLRERGGGGGGGRSTPKGKKRKLRLWDESTTTYRSALLQFRAYRLSPFFRTKAGLQISSNSHSHKIDPHKIMCRYALHGACMDPSCTGQHLADFKLSTAELLEDLAA